MKYIKSEKFEVTPEEVIEIIKAIIKFKFKEMEDSTNEMILRKHMEKKESKKK